MRSGQRKLLHIGFTITFMNQLVSNFRCQIDRIVFKLNTHRDEIMPSTTTELTQCNRKSHLHELTGELTSIVNSHHLSRSQWLQLPNPTARRRIQGGDLWVDRDAEPDYAKEASDPAQALFAHLLRQESAVAPHNFLTQSAIEVVL